MDDLPRVAFQGEHGAFSEAALEGHFPGGARSIPSRTFAAVGDAVLQGRADVGILPVENTLAGSVQESNDVVFSGRFDVIGEIAIGIRHCLLGVEGAEVGGVREVRSHPVALAQCRRFLGGIEAEAVSTYDTAGAAREVAELGDPSVAAIAPRGAAARYGLGVLASDLQDRDDNQTRFFIVRAGGGPEGVGAGLVEPGKAESRQVDSGRAESGPAETGQVAARRVAAAPAAPEGTLRTVVLLELENRAGALRDALGPFARHGINLSRLESRPAPEPWCYRFLFEFESDGGDASIPDAMAEVAAGCVSLQWLGTFPVGGGPLRSGLPG